MNYRSICTGIAAETVAWHELGWKPLSFAEIDPFCCALLKHYYPETKNYGDFTKQEADGIETDVLIGGTPCQSFSVAGKRAGLDDPRGNLALEFIRLAQRLRPRWIIWENVKGVLSSWSYDERSRDETNDFDTFLAALAECGYGFAYRVLDAQYDGLAQRRQRVFVVGYLGDWRPPAAVLFERESLRRDLAPSRKAGQEVAGTLGARTKGGGGFGTDLELGGGLQVTGTLRSGSHGGSSHGKLSGSDQVPMVSMALNAHGGAGRMDGESETFIAHTLSADGFDASEDGTGLGSPLVVSSFLPGQGSKGRGIGYAEEQSPTLRSGDGSAKNIGISFRTAGDGNVYESGEQTAPLATGTDPSANVTFTDVAPSMPSGGNTTGGNRPPGTGPETATSLVGIGQAVRRLTPMEWERLMGFPDRYTLIPYPRKKDAKDGPRYKAIGNSISVPTLRWIGKRIQTVDEILAGLTNPRTKP